MAVTYTDDFKIAIARQIKEQLDESDENVYFFIGRPSPWADESTPPETQDDVSSFYKVWDESLSFKKVSTSDSSYVIPRTDWVVNSVFNQFDDTIATSNNFFVFTEDYNVYKCLWNDSGENSTQKPTGTANTVQTTADGYKWKYMFSVSGPDATKFLTTNYIPVKTLTSNDGSSQWNVQQSAIDGAIHTIKLNNGGSLYSSLSGIITANSANASIVFLDASASATNNTYNNFGIYVTSGTGAGQYRKISSYVGSTKQIVTTTPFTTPLNTSSNYYISPYVNISGNGSNATAYSLVNSGSITAVNVLDVGAGYTTANVTFTSNGGTGASARAIIAPKGGHGSDPVSELKATNLMLSVKLDATEGGKFTVNNEYRTVGLVSNILTANGSFANSVAYDQSRKLTVTGFTGQFIADETITGLTSGATGKVVDFVSNTTIRVIQTSGTFANSEVISGGTSISNATITAITAPELLKNSGKVLYFENRSPIARSSDQREYIKVTLKF